MKRGGGLKAVLSVLVLLTAAARCESPYSNPPPTFHESDLVGTWEARYMEWGVDRLIFRADGTFKQIYSDHTVEGYVYETPWNEWWVEYLPDGRVRVHLQGARYYLAGIRTAELDGMGNPCPEEMPDCGWEHNPWSFYDPIADESLHMIGELVLNVRSDSSGRLLLHHMWTTPDRGFAIIGGEAEEFHRVEAPISLLTPPMQITVDCPLPSR